MFGLGFWEIFTIVLIAVILINPKEMPKIARKFGTWFKKFRELKETVDREVDEIKSDFNRKEK